MTGSHSRKKGQRAARKARAEDALAQLLQTITGSDAGEDFALEKVTLPTLLEEARAVPRNAQAVWVVAARPLRDQPLPHPESGEPVLPWMVVILDARTGQVLSGGAQPEPDPEDVAQALLLNMLAPQGTARPVRPARILTQDPDLARSLNRLLKGLGVAAERHDLPGLSDALDEMAREIGNDLRDQRPLPFLEGVPGPEVREISVVFEHFLDAAPWRVFPGTQPIYCRWEADGQRAAGQCYAAVMGQAGQEFGLALYPDWLNYARHIHNAHDTEAVLEITGGLEALTLSVPAQFHPGDLAALERAGADARRLPGLLRVGPDGPLPPLTPTGPLTALLKLLAQRAAGRRSAVTSVKAARGGVQVRYPAGPREELTGEQRAGSVQVTLTSPPGLAGQAAGQLVFSGPADLPLRKALREVRHWLDERRIRTYPPHRLQLRPADDGQAVPVEERLWEPRAVIWDDRMGAPDLTLAHLSWLPELEGLPYALLRAEWRSSSVEGLEVSTSFRATRKSGKAVR